MPWALPAALRRTILELVRGKYAGDDFRQLLMAAKTPAEITLALAELWWGCQG
jgi:hypothetical protein